MGGNISSCQTCSTVSQNQKKKKNKINREKNKIEKKTKQKKNIKRLHKGKTKLILSSGRSGMTNVVSSLQQQVSQLI